jgi:hypothetical protein
MYTTFKGMDGAPNPNEVDIAVKDLNAAGYTLAANTMSALLPELTKRRIIAWLSLPPEKRKPVDDYMLQQYAPTNINRRFLVSVGIELLTAPPADVKLNADDYFQFVTWFGADTGQLNIDQVEQIGASTAAALRLLQWVILANPDDVTLQRRAVIDIHSQLHCNDKDTVDFFQFLLAHLPPHYARGVRHDFFVLLHGGRLHVAGIAFTDFQTDKDPLVAAEALLAVKDYPTASAKYRVVLDDAPAEPIERRLAAWSGLWDANPELALAATAALTTELTALPAGDARKRLLRWFGAEMGRVAPALTNPLFTAFPHLTSPESYRQMASSMTALLQCDPIACLSLDANGQSLRHDAALIYMLAKMGDEANDILLRRIEYMEIPRPGTRLSAGLKPGVALKFISPRKEESEQTSSALIADLVFYTRGHGNTGTDAVTPEPPNLKLLAQEGDVIAAETDGHLLQREMRNLSEQFTLAISYLDPTPAHLLLKDPPPPPRAVNMAYVTTLTAVISKVFQQQLACQNGDIFVAEGLQKSMLTATNPQLLDAIFQLSLTVLDQCVAAHGTGIPGSIANFANAIEGRKIWNMQPYAAQLRAKYLQPVTH